MYLLVTFTLENVVINRDALIIGLVFGIGHYRPLFQVLVSVISERCNQYCNKCTNM